MKNIVMLVVLLTVTLHMACKEVEVVDDDAQLRIDLELIDAFIEEKGLSGQVLIDDASEIRYIIHTAGVGDKISFGQSVTTSYTGILLDSTEFDSGDNLTFVVGLGAVIRGWDMMFSQFQRGTEATIFIPSTLAYGSTPRGTIPGDSPLIFDVEVLDVR